MGGYTLQLVYKENKRVVVVGVYTTGGYGLEGVETLYLTSRKGILYSIQYKLRL